MRTRTPLNHHLFLHVCFENFWLKKNKEKKGGFKISIIHNLRPGTKKKNPF